ncbi:hypothetical protein MNB_SV-12-268 [hydrothermal vent metagenome]|uniref:Uncharacterized protein n=1 Tax=hydrothermal vent metagenome TaxID=652676 RepID=A0A1W1C9Z9_9ZZZZ
MSQAPQNLPKRTRVLIKDILFQEKYRLTHTQMDVMAYIINALSWATKIGAFFPLTNKKFREDLPQISEKTLEESLRVLKSLGLIEVEMITVPTWKNARVRGISVLPKGLEYNSSYYKADEKEIIDNLRKQVTMLQNQLKNIKTEEIETEIPSEIENIILEKTNETENKILEEAKNSTKYDNLEFTELVKTVTKEFGETSEPICNGVKGWQKESKFYINSYNKVAVLTPLGDFIQLKDPLDISDFWKYLDKNRHKIGEIVDYTKELTIEELNRRYIGLDINLNNTKLSVYKIEEFKNGVKVILKDGSSGKSVVISRGGKHVVLGLKECEDTLLGLRC